jgi:hypothetical protein
MEAETSYLHRSGGGRSSEKSSLAYSTAGNRTPQIESFSTTRPPGWIAIPPKSEVSSLFIDAGWAWQTSLSFS